VLDKRKDKIKNLKQFQSPNFGTKNRESEPTHQKTAKILGVGSSTVSNTRTILDSDNEEVKEKVRSGEWSIDKGAKEIRKEKKLQKESSSKPTFNQVNENCIEVLDKKRKRGGDRGNQYTGGKILEPKNCQTEPSRNKGLPGE